MSIFEIVYWAGIVIEAGIRVPLRKGWKQTPKAEQRITTTEKGLLGLLFVTMVGLPLGYSLNLLDFANYALPEWAGWLGVALMLVTLAVYVRAHIDLKTNWSPSLEIYRNHTLVTSGIYRYIRHPMYASQWLWVLAQILLLQNWIAGPLDLLFFIPFYVLRVRAEEQMMLDTFGEEYRVYMKKTGRVIPPFGG